MYITNHNKSYLCPNTVRLYSFAEAKSTLNLFKLTASSLSWCTCKTVRWFRRSCLVTIAKSWIYKLQCICENRDTSDWFLHRQIETVGKAVNIIMLLTATPVFVIARLSDHLIRLIYWRPHHNTDHVSCQVRDPDESKYLELYCLELLLLCLLFQTCQ